MIHWFGIGTRANISHRDIDCTSRKAERKPLFATPERDLTFGYDAAAFAAGRKPGNGVKIRRYFKRNFVADDVAIPVKPAHA